MRKSLQSFRDSLTDSAYLSRRPRLLELLRDIIAGSSHMDDLFPYFLSHTREMNPAVTIVPQLQKISNLTQPHMWYMYTSYTLQYYCTLYIHVLLHTVIC